MSTSNNSPAPARPSFDAYTAMLLVSLLCITAACAVLYLELSPYGAIFQWWVVPRGS